MAREQDARDDSQSDTNREKQRSAVKNSVDRLQRGSAWLLEKYMPIEKRNSGRRSQDRTAVQVLSEGQGLALVLCHRSYLRQTLKAGTEAHIRVGVGEQAPLRPDNIRIQVFSDLSRIDEAGYEFEAYLRHGRTSISSGMRHRYGNERVESVEIRRREPNRPTSRSGEFGIAGIIDPAPHYRLLVAQHSQLLSARAVELN